MFIVGVDVAKRSHEAIIIDGAGNVVKKAFNFKNDSSGFIKLTDALKSVSNNPEDFTIGMESTAHYWLALYSNLQQAGYKVQVFNPIQSNALRAMYIRQVKNDEHDSFIIAEVIRFGRHSQGGMPPSQLYELRELCRTRFFVVDMIADLKRKVITLLDQVFPEYERIFSDIFGVSSTEVLLRCSTPAEVLATDIRTLTRLVQISSNNKFGRAKALGIKECAKKSFGIRLENNILGTLIKQHLAHIRYSTLQINEIDAKIKELFVPYNSLLTSIPGIGISLGATIFSEIGDISRFSSASKLAAFAGIDPTVKQSGEFTGTHNRMSKRGSPYLRRALWQASTIAVHYDPALKAFFDKKRKEGKTYMVSIGHITKKLTNIIYAVLRDNKPYYSNQVNPLAE